MQTTEHTRIVTAPPQVLYDLVGDVTLWPALFGPSVYVRHLEKSPAQERFQLWATVNGSVTSWVSRRTLDEDGLRISFEQEVSRPPFASMGGEWLFRELTHGRTEVVLRHHFVPVDDTEETLGRITAALDANSHQELAALGQVAELGHPVGDIAFSFSDTLELEGDAAAAYEFVARADLWPERLPHVGRVRLTEPADSVQELEMDTVTTDGSSHTTRSVRVCQAPEWIAYKQQLPPKTMIGHSGLWTFDGTAVTSRHTVVLDPSAVTDLAATRAFVREALGRNSTATMTHAVRYSSNKSRS